MVRTSASILPNGGEPDCIRVDWVDAGRMQATPPYPDRMTNTVVGTLTPL